MIKDTRWGRRNSPGQITNASFHMLADTVDSFLSPLIVASVNLYKHPLSDAGAFVKRHQDKIDILCVQEISRGDNNVAHVWDQDKDARDLRTFKKITGLDASSIAITQDAGVIVLNPAITVREVIPRGRLIEAKLLSSTPVVRDQGDGNPCHFTVICVYAPAHS